MDVVKLETLSCGRRLLPDNQQARVNICTICYVYLQRLFSRRVCDWYVRGRPLVQYWARRHHAEWSWRRPHCIWASQLCEGLLGLICTEAMCKLSGWSVTCSLHAIECRSDASWYRITITRGKNTVRIRPNPSSTSEYRMWSAYSAYLNSVQYPMLHHVPHMHIHISNWMCAGLLHISFQTWIIFRYVDGESQFDAWIVPITTLSRY